jgi:putative nucleotidyltransferase with HDIG domain
MAATAQKEDRGAPFERAFPQYWRYVLQALLLGIFLIAALTFLLSWRTGQEAAAVVGEASPVEILAKQRVTYASEIATEAERNRAANAIKDVYTPPDLQVIRQQLDLAQSTFAYMTTLRSDPYLTISERVTSIEQVSDLNIPQTILRTALTFDEPSWQNTITTTLKVVGQVMQEGIRESQLLEVRTRLATWLSSEILSAEQEKVIVGIARSLIKPTSFYDAKATAEARQKARDEVKPVQRTIEKGQAILRAGDIVTPAHIEQLDALGMMKTGRGWEDLAGAALLAAVTVILPGAFIQRLRPRFWVHWRRTLLVCLTMLLNVTMAKFMIPGHALLPYLFPMASTSMLLALLLADTSIAIVITAVLSLSVGFIAGGSLELTTLAFVTGVAGALGISRRERAAAFVRTGIWVSLTSIIVSVVFRYYSGKYDLTAVSQLAVIGLANGVLSASLTFALFSWIGRIFGVTTSLHLLELSRPTQPLLRQLALKAPGTYHHTLIVANMAEQAAEAVGADGLLTRIGAYYHDIGKTLRPYFFIENSIDRENIHDRLDPKTSAQIIISHTKDGLEMAKKNGLPAEVQAIIVQHHGTTLASFFYQQASQKAPEGEVIDEAEFRYPGPKPQSKEAAIVMLADVEAAVRSARPSSLEETERLVRQFINVRLVSGELDECDLTLRDLDKIRQAFVSVLKGVFHPRIQYPVEAKDPGRVVGPLMTKSAAEPAKE